jgi:hypothetical protein
MKYLHRIFLFLIVALAAIQFIRPEKNIAAGESPNHISKVFSVPDDVKQILSASCNDCHSNNTHYPWYNSVQPLSWWLNQHVKEGKEHLNFDVFASYRLRKQFHKFEEIAEMVKEDEMPLPSYTLIHRDAVLSSEQKIILTDWSNRCLEQMKSAYPIDSLVRKKENTR